MGRSLFAQDPDAEAVAPGLSQTYLHIMCSLFAYHVLPILKDGAASFPTPKTVTNGQMNRLEE